MRELLAVGWQVAAGMSCKVCGRPRNHTIAIIPLIYGNIIEFVCWTCCYWRKFGKLYDVR